MKSKTAKILGVALTTVLLASMLMFTLPMPVSAAPGNVVWENVPTPSIVVCRTLGNVGATLGPIEQNSDGTIFYAYDSSGAAGYVLFTSTDCGRCWTATTYNFGAIVAIAASPSEPNTVFVATASEVYRSNDAGTTWINVAVSPIVGATTITCLDVATLSPGRYLLACGATKIVPAVPDLAEVYTLDTGGTFPPVWVDTDFYDQMAIDYPIFAPTIDSIVAVAITPNTSETLGFVAIGNDSATSTDYVSVKIGGARWGGDIGELDTDTVVAGLQPIQGATTSTGAIAFPAGFSWSNCLFYFGINDTVAVPAVEGVYSFWGIPFPGNSFSAPLAVAATNDVISLACSGQFGTAAVLAGLQNGGVLRSLDGGATWLPIYKAPSGAANAYVMIDESTDCAGWYALISGANGGLSLSTDSGATWNQIALVLNTITSIYDLAFLADGTLFMATNGAAGNDCWRLSTAGVWERVFTSTLPGATAFSLVEAVPGSSGTVFLADFFVLGPQKLWRSTNAGQLWAQQANAVPIPAGQALNTWLIVSDTKQIIGVTNGFVYITNFNGISWSPGVNTGLGNVFSLAVDPTDSSRLMAGGTTGNVAVSLSGGLTWPYLYAAAATGLNAGGNVFVSFDAATPTVMYASDTVAAVPGVVRRLSLAPLDLWARIDAQGQDNDTAAAGGEEYPVGPASGIASSALGPLYVTDSRVPVTPTPPAVAAGAMFRTLDPTATVSLPAVFNTPYWENAYEATPAGTLALAAVQFGALPGTSNLWLTAGAGNIPTLWAIDTSGIPGIWKYTDILAKGTSLGSPQSASETWTDAWDVNTTATTATIGWAPFATPEGATAYQLQVNSRADWNPATFVTTITSYYPDTTALITGLAPGTTYYARVRAATQTAVTAGAVVTPAGVGAPVRSPWSNTVTFATQLGQATPPLPLVPLPGAQNVILNPTFDWDPVPGAASYSIVVATDPAFANVVCSGSPTSDFWQCDTTLDCYTHYYWKVSPVDAGGAPAGTPINSVFTTQACATGTPVYIWIIIAIGAVLVIVVIWLIFTTRARA